MEGGYLLHNTHTHTHTHSPHAWAWVCVVKVGKILLVKQLKLRVVVSLNQCQVKRNGLGQYVVLEPHNGQNEEVKSSMRNHSCVNNVTAADNRYHYFQKLDRENK